MSEEVTDNALTLRDFRQWLSGVEEMQGEDWTPNQQQWKKIREKIDNIIEGSAPVMTTTPATVINTVSETLAPQAPAAPVQQPAGGSALADVPKQPQKKRLSNGPQNRLPQNSAMIDANAANPRATTPNIDTSDGSYESGFI